MLVICTYVYAASVASRSTLIGPPRKDRVARLRKPRHPRVLYEPAFGFFLRFILLRQPMRMNRIEAHTLSPFYDEEQRNTADGWGWGGSKEPGLFP